MQQPIAAPDSAAIYCRQSNLSKKAKDEKSVSIESQFAACRETAKKEKLAITQEFSENITSEVVDDRPQLQLALARAQEYKTLIVYRYDRIARDPNDLTRLINLFRSQGIRVISATESELAPDPMGDMIMYIQGSLAKIEKLKTADRVKRAKAQILESGKLVGNGKAIFGYRYVKDQGKSGRIREIVEEEKPIVQRIFQLISTGTSANAVASLFRAEQLPTRRGGNWDHTAIVKIIRDPSYHGAAATVNKNTEFHTDEKGQVRRVESGTGRKARKRNSPADHRPIGAGTPQIVSEKLWRQANAQLTANTKNRFAGKLPLFLRGHIFCGACGSAMVAGENNGKLTYHCGARMAGKVDHPPLFWHVDKVEQLVWARISHKLERPEVIREMILTELNRESGPDWQKELEGYQATAKQLKAKLANAVARFADETDSEILEAAATHMRAQRQQLARVQELIESTQASVERQKDRERIADEGLNLVKSSQRLISNPSFEDRVKLIKLLRVRVELSRGEPLPQGVDLVVSTLRLYPQNQETHTVENPGKGKYEWGKINKVCSVQLFGATAPYVQASTTPESNLTSGTPQNAHPLLYLPCVQV